MQLIPNSVTGKPLMDPPKAPLAEDFTRATPPRTIVKPTDHAPRIIGDAIVRSEHLYLY